MKKSIQYLHIGENHVLPLREIIGIINIENAIPPETADFIEKAEAEKRFYKIGQESGAKSLIIGARNVYQSPISSVTLSKRAMEKFWEEKNE